MHSSSKTGIYFLLSAKILMKLVLQLCQWIWNKVLLNKRMTRALLAKSFHSLSLKSKLADVYKSSNFSSLLYGKHWLLFMKSKVYSAIA